MVSKGFYTPIATYACQSLTCIIKCQRKNHADSLRATCRQATPSHATARIPVVVVGGVFLCVGSSCNQHYKLKIHDTNLPNSSYSDSSMVLTSGSFAATSRQKPTQARGSFLQVRMIKSERLCRVRLRVRYVSLRLRTCTKKVVAHNLNTSKPTCRRVVDTKTLDIARCSTRTPY